MSASVFDRAFKRREFLSSAMGMAGLAAAGGLLTPAAADGAIAHKSLDPVNPDILFGSTSSLWSGQHDIVWGIKRIKALGLQGIEPYAAQIESYRQDPMELKKIFDDHGVTMIDVSNGARGQSTNFIDPDQIPKTIADHGGVIEVDSAARRTIFRLTFPIATATKQRRTRRRGPVEMEGVL